MSVNFIKLSQFYVMTFNEAKALVTRLTWDKVPGANKLRKFFLAEDWQDCIVSVSVSGSGAKGGVFFLEIDVQDKQALARRLRDPQKIDLVWQQLIQDELITPQGYKTSAGRRGNLPAQVLVYTGNKTEIQNELRRANVKRCFVVKGAEDPGRTLFAEYVLALIGKAKIPKSMVMKVDPQPPPGSPNPSEGMLMLQVLGDPNKRSAQTDPQRYAESYSYLDDGSNAAGSRISYLVVQKLIPGNTLPIVNSINAEIKDFLIEQKLKVVAESFQADASFAGMSESQIGDIINALEVLGCLTRGGIVTQQYDARLSAVPVLSSKQSDIARILKTAYDSKQIVTDGSFATDSKFESMVPQEIADLVAILKQIRCIASDNSVDQKYAATLAGVAAINSKLPQIKAILRSSKEIVDRNKVTFTKTSTDEQFDELEAALAANSSSPLMADFQKLYGDLTKQIQLIETIIGSADKMRNSGRIIFADLPIGMADRFENMNTGNFFYIDRPAKPGAGKVANPVGCIDSEANLYKFVPVRNAPVKQGFTDAEDYVDGLLSDGTVELWPDTVNPPPPGYVRAPSAALVQMLDVGTYWFDKIFFPKFFVGVPKCVIKQFGSSFYVQGDRFPYNSSKRLPAWQQARVQIQQGFCEALIDFQKVPLHQFRQVYAKQASAYGKSINFDFKGFAVRYYYLSKVNVDTQNWTVVLPDYNVTKAEIIARLGDLLGGIGVASILTTALSSPEGNAVLVAQGLTDQQIFKFLEGLPLQAQEALIPCPFGANYDTHKRYVPFGNLDQTKRQAILAEWKTLDGKYLRRINRVICAILAKLYMAYVKDAQLFPTTYYLISESLAYNEAKKDAQTASELKLYKDGGSQSEKRIALLNKYGLPDN